MNTKCRILFLREMFIKYTDSEHYYSMPNIAVFLESNGFTAHIQTIRDDIDSLIAFGMDIEYVHNKGYHLKSRPFSLSILKLFADVIASFHFLTVEDSEKLLKLLESLCSIYEAPILHRQIRLDSRVKAENGQIFENIDSINYAICNNQQISFDYYDYDIDKRFVCRDEEKYTCSPCALVMNDERYYVVSHYEKYPDCYTNFRLDHMKNIELINSKRTFPNGELDLEQYIKSSFCMVSGKNEYVTLRFPLENRYCNIVIDRFGKSVIMLKDLNSGKFTIHVPIKTEYPQPFFAWIFSFDGAVEIIEPLSLMTRYTEMLTNALKKAYHL